jgi:hypothetical protein
MWGEMAWFRRSIPEGEFREVAAAIATELNKHCDSWFIALRSDPESAGIHWLNDSLTGDARNYVNMLQMSVVASAFFEKQYFRSMPDSMLVQEIIYGLLTNDKPDSLHGKIEQFLPLMSVDGDIGKSFRLWAASMAPLFSVTDPERTAKQLEKWLTILVSKAMIATYEAFGDTKSAKKIRSLYGR